MSWHDRDQREHDVGEHGGVGVVCPGAGAAHHLLHGPVVAGVVQLDQPGPGAGEQLGVVFSGPPETALSQLIQILVNEIEGDSVL